MPKNLEAITLPEAEEIRERIYKHVDQQYIAEKMSKELMRFGGQERNAPGIVLMIQLALHDVVEGLPPMPAFVKLTLQEEVNTIINALVDDEEVRQHALQIQQEVLDS